MLRGGVARRAVGALRAPARRWAGASAGPQQKKQKVSVPRLIFQLTFFGAMVVMGVYVVVWLPVNGLLRWMGLKDRPAALTGALTNEEMTAIKEDVKEVARDVRILTAKVNNLAKLYLPPEMESTAQGA